MFFNLKKCKWVRFGVASVKPYLFLINTFHSIFASIKNIN